MEGNTFKDISVVMGQSDAVVVKHVAAAMIAHSRALEALAKSLKIDCSQAVGIKIESPRRD